MKVFRVIAAVSLATFSATASAQDILTIKADWFEETRSKESLISVPYWLRGVQYASEPTELRPKLQLVPPAGLSDEKLCLNATTIDGRFSIEGEYRLPPELGLLNAGDPIELSYPTKFPKTWSDVTKAKTSIVLFEGECATTVTSGQSSRIVPAVFNGSTDLQTVADDRISLMFAIHARNTQELGVSLSIGADQFGVSCTKIASSDAIQFNFNCISDIPAAASGDAELAVTRLSGGREAPKWRAQLLLPRLQ